MAEDITRKADTDKISRDEFELATNDIKKYGPFRALASSRNRLSELHEQTLENSKTTIACGKGCWFCCYYKVDVRAEEVFEIVNYIRSNLSSEALKTIRADITTNAKTMKNLDHASQLSINIKCTFLVDGACSIYPVRPEKCRTFHAQDMEGCQASYEQPENLTIPNSFHEDLHKNEAALTEGYNFALYQAGYDASVYEMNTALNLCLTDQKPKKKWRNKKRAFSSTYVRE